MKTCRWMDVENQREPAAGWMLKINVKTCRWMDVENHYLTYLLQNKTLCMENVLYCRTFSAELNFLILK